MSSPSPRPSSSKTRSPSPSPNASADGKASPSPQKDESEAPAQESSKTEGDAAPENAAPATDSSSPAPAPATQHEWQAIYSPAHNAYYFYNARTNETTWQNPLQPASSQPSASTSAHASASPEPQAQAQAGPSSATSPGPGSNPAVAHLYAMQAAAAAQGIDPSLAFLDPSLAQPGGAGPQPFEFTAKFNARTGAFARPDARDPGHLSEYERMKRMSEVYFDMAEWERQVALQKEEEEREGKKRKRPTKKDLVSARGVWMYARSTDVIWCIQDRWKEQKKQKKIAKTAWLRT
ncbi:hypothetical protein GLOTRDRAFT_81824 [Gloeophyllum trabeum ATCC 11539]|uniref:WW domain-containing protein n=1 Tax=Gloeophyllum trabeum (strain ATCC 11539 / FP-39264 / Madison 617) TaxID=670483 RepID=S7PSG0_GLOTA|nr:uncharacterized protein GLOTRDRAFT_81824 [Gloeophyllum trabeum ATCC 11539]EPQ50751.1 hypothetical protein GLOTRDRAFT_81824 [Gloeophyllum trabeum ATCC 11539]